MNLPLYVCASILASLLIWWGLRSRVGRRIEQQQAKEHHDTVVSWPPQATRVLTHAERQAYELVRNALPAHMILAQAQGLILLAKVGDRPAGEIVEGLRALLAVSLREEA